MQIKLVLAQKFANDDNSSSNKNIRIDNWRPDIGPRIINVDKDTSRYLVGLRGQTDSGWDWETAIASI